MVELVVRWLHAALTAVFVAKNSRGDAPVLLVAGGGVASADAAWLSGWCLDG